MIGTLLIETELELGKVVSDTQNNFRTIAERNHSR